MRIACYHELKVLAFTCENFACSSKFCGHISVRCMAIVMQDLQGSSSCQASLPFIHCQVIMLVIDVTLCEQLAHVIYEA